MAEQTAVGAAIRRARVGRGLSLRGLAARVGVSPATMSAVENGRTPVSVPRLQRIADQLDVSPAHLLRGAEPSPPAGTQPGAAGSTGERDWRSFDDLELDPVLEAATRLFVRLGFHATSMRQIAAEAGRSVAGIYHHHPTKERILAALLDLTMTELGWRVAAARQEGADPEESFALMVESLALFHAVRGDLAFLGASEMRGLSQVERGRIAGMRADLQHALEDQADLCVRHGRVPAGDTATACRAIATMCTSLPSWFRVDGPLTPQEVARRYAAYGLALLRA